MDIIYIEFQTLDPPGYPQARYFLENFYQPRWKKFPQSDFSPSFLFIACSFADDDDLEFLAALTFENLCFLCCGMLGIFLWKAKSLACERNKIENFFTAFNNFFVGF